MNLPCLQFKQCLGIGKARGLWMSPQPTHSCLLKPPEEEAQLYLLPLLRFMSCASEVHLSQIQNILQMDLKKLFWHHK